MFSQRGRYSFADAHEILSTVYGWLACSCGLFYASSRQLAHTVYATRWYVNRQFLAYGHGVKACDISATPGSGSSRGYRIFGRWWIYTFMPTFFSAEFHYMIFYANPIKSYDII